MRHSVIVSILLLAASGAAAAQSSSPEHSPPAAPSASHAQAMPAIKWGPVPPVFPKGAEIAVLAGNPFGNGEYTVRLRMPSGYVIPPHFHPTDENVTVISGTLEMGQGDAIDRKAMTALHAGGFFDATAQTHHYVEARGLTIVQVHGLGPFAITYVNPKDAPTGAGASR